MYVAMTRAQHNLHLIEPQAYYVTHQPRLGGKHVYGARSRFLCEDVIQTLDTQCPVNNTLSAKSVPANKPAESNVQPSAQKKTGDPSNSRVAGAIRDLF